MENTLSIYIQSLNETWEMPDDMVLKLNEFQKEHPAEATNADKEHEEWFATLSAADQQKINRRKPDEPAQ